MGVVLILCPQNYRLVAGILSICCHQWLLRLVASHRQQKMLISLGHLFVVLR